MSRYLIRRIEETPNIALRTRTEIEALEGDGRARARHLARRGRRAHDRRHPPRLPDDGRRPEHRLARGCVALDDKGFVKAGPDLLRASSTEARWPLPRAPLLFETSLPGVFAVGDVRANSVKRVAAAVGEGSVCVQLVHKVLAE